MKIRQSLAGAAFAMFLCVAAPAAAKDGFKSLFDGKTLTGWRGDPALWSVKDGAITGRFDTPLKHSSFLIYSKPYADFELHFRFRFERNGNSGFQFRSTVADEAKFDVAGYQANVVPPDQLVRYGMLYDNLGRNEIALLSERVEIGDDGGKVVRKIGGSVNPVAALLADYRPYPQWNDYVVIAVGNRIVHAINGALVLDAVDNAPAAKRSGLFALQLDFGQPMIVQFKDIEAKPVRAMPDLGKRFVTKPGPPETTPEIPKRPRR